MHEILKIPIQRGRKVANFSPRSVRISAPLFCASLSFDDMNMKMYDDAIRDFDRFLSFIRPFLSRTYFSIHLIHSLNSLTWVEDTAVSA